MDQNSRAYLMQKAREAARQYGVPEDLFIALIEQESRFDPNVVSPKGAIGLTQLMPGTASDMGVDPNTIEGNLAGGAKYLNYTMGLYPNNLNLALAAYNAGPGRVKEYGGVPPFKETQNYIKAILGRLPGGKPANMPLSANMTDRPVPPKEENMKFMDYLGNPQSLKDRMMQRNPATGLTPVQNIAANMDALVLRGYGIGDKIRQKGAQEAVYEEKQGQRNATIDMLKQRAKMGDKLAADILQAVQSKSLSAAQGVALYYKERLAKPDASFTLVKGSELGLTGKDAERFFNRNSVTGEIKPVSTGPLIDQSVNKLNEMDIEYTKQFFGNAGDIRTQLQTIRRQIELSNKPDFDAGAGSELIQSGKALLKRLGFEDIEVASNQEFLTLMRQQVLDRLGGSLGVGISASDVTYLDNMQANPRMDKRAIRDILLATEALLERQQEIQAFARQYMRDNNLKTLDFVMFEEVLAEHFKDKPLFN